MRLVSKVTRKKARETYEAYRGVISGFVSTGSTSFLFSVGEYFSITSNVKVRILRVLMNDV